jgi:hypothetical protein
MEHRAGALHSTSRVVALVGVVAALGAAPSLAQAATARLEVPSGPANHASTRAQIAFHLGSGWSVVHGKLENTPAIGSYSRAHDLGHDASCILQFDAEGIVLRAAQRPRFDGRRLHLPRPTYWQAADLPAAQHGQFAAGRWWIGLPGTASTEDLGGGTRWGSPRLVGFASLATPSWFVPTGRPVTAVRFQLHATIEKWAATPQGLVSLVPTRTERDNCTTYTRSHINPILRAALPTIRVARKH